MLSPKIIAQDSGHLCQNLYLASEAIGAGTCAIGAYDQAKIDPILGVDGEEEFTIYMAPVGKIKTALVAEARLLLEDWSEVEDDHTRWPVLPKLAGGSGRSGCRLHRDAFSPRLHCG